MKNFLCALFLLFSWCKSMEYHILTRAEIDESFQNAKNADLKYHIAKHDPLEMIECLLKHGANPNDRDAWRKYRTLKGKTPLYIAILYNNLEVIKLLIKYGADVNACFKKGTLLDIAYGFLALKKEKDIYKEIIALLESCGAKRGACLN